MKKRSPSELLAGTRSLGLASILFSVWVLTIFISWAPLYFYMGNVVDKLRQENANILQFYAGIHQIVASSDEIAPEFLKEVFDLIIHRTDIPIINTDRERVPQYWEGIGIEPTDKRPETIERVQKIVTKLEREFDPIPLIYTDPASGTNTVLGYLYYGDSEVITRLQYLPTIEIALVALFILLGLIGSYLVFKNIQKSEQRAIWAGMAKETAHQLGTPLSSLMGWIELLKSTEDPEQIPPDTLIEMEKDVGRLYKVTSRFSYIGSKAELTPTAIAPILRDVVAYFDRRLPHMRKKILIIEDYQPVPEIPLNRFLFEWVIENLLKNAIDAIKREDGEIIIKLRARENGKSHVLIDIIDNGVGIAAINKNIIFKPGYSTKKRGWGLGLNLARRIVEEYHDGRLFIRESRVNEGTTMRIIL